VAYRKIPCCTKGSLRLHFTVLLFAILLWTNLSGNASFAGEPIPVFVSIPPQKYFVEKIGGSLVHCFRNGPARSQSSHLRNRDPAR